MRQVKTHKRTLKISTIINTKVVKLLFDMRFHKFWIYYITTKTDVNNENNFRITTISNSYKNI